MTHFVSGGGRMSDPRAAYQRARVTSATPAELVVLMYERLLADLKGGAAAMRSGDIPTKAKFVQNATDILFELFGALDEEQGGEVTQRLAALYNYMIGRIGEASRSMDPAVLDELAGHVEALTVAWREVASEHGTASRTPPS